MARLRFGERDARKEAIWRLCSDLSEREIAEMMGVHRRTVNNYLRELLTEGRVLKWGRHYIRERRFSC